MNETEWLQRRLYLESDRFTWLQEAEKNRYYDSVAFFNSIHMSEQVDTTVSSKFRHFNDQEVGGVITVWSQR